MCWNKEKDANWDIKWLRMTAIYGKDTWTADAKPIWFPVNSSNIKDINGSSPSYTDCNVRCPYPSAQYNELCWATKIIESTEDVTKEVSADEINKEKSDPILTANVTKQQVKAWWESITFSWNFPLVNECRLDYSSVWWGGSSSITYKVSYPLFVKNGSFIKITCKGQLFKEFKFTEESSEVGTTTNSKPTLSVDKTSTNIWWFVIFSWNSNWWTNCYTVVNWNKSWDLSWISWTIPINNLQTATTYNNYVKCKFNWIDKSSDLVTVTVLPAPAPIPTVMWKSSWSQDFIDLLATNNDGTRVNNLRTRAWENATMKFWNIGWTATCTLNWDNVPNYITTSGTYTYSCKNTTSTKTVTFSITVLPTATLSPTCNTPEDYYHNLRPDVPVNQWFIHWNKFWYKEQRQSCWPKPDYAWEVRPYVQGIIAQYWQTDQAYQLITTAAKKLEASWYDMEQIIPEVAYGIIGKSPTTSEINTIRTYFSTH